MIQTPAITLLFALSTALLTTQASFFHEFEPSNPFLAVQNMTQARFLAEKALKTPAKTYTHSMRLRGNSTLGYYYLNIYVGTPPQIQSVIVDTGSAITTFPCTDC